MRETDDPTVGSSRTINIGQDAQKNVCTLQDAVSSMTSLRDDWTVAFRCTMQSIEYSTTFRDHLLHSSERVCTSITSHHALFQSRQAHDSNMEDYVVRIGDR